jgi:hypothetical protein
MPLLALYANIRLEVSMLYFDLNLLSDLNTNNYRISKIEYNTEQTEKHTYRRIPFHIVVSFLGIILILRMVLYGFISDLNLVQILYPLNENHITGGYISRIGLIGINMHGNLIFRIYPYQNISKYQFTIS